MTKEAQIMTLHPEGKQGVNILQRRYDVMRDFLLETIDQSGEISFGDLTQAAKAGLNGKFDGSIGWYVTTVKLDLEARQLIERIPGSSPQMIRMKDSFIR
ncbi:MAG: hypothetical protein AAFV07_03990, partial [Bacteroidota bacterium]